MEFRIPRCARGEKFKFTYLGTETTAQTKDIDGEDMKTFAEFQIQKVTTALVKDKTNITVVHELAESSSIPCAEVEIIENVVDPPPPKRGKQLIVCPVAECARDKPGGRGHIAGCPVIKYFKNIPRKHGLSVRACQIAAYNENIKNGWVPGQRRSARLSRNISS